MGYLRQNFVSNQTLTAEALNKIEGGIIDNEAAISKLALKAVDGSLVISDNIISINISAEDGNILVKKSDGLYASASSSSGISAGEGLMLVDGTMSIKIAQVSHGLAAVDGALMLNLATEKADGAMSKEDKIFINSLRGNSFVTQADVSQQIKKAWTWIEI